MLRELVGGALTRDWKLKVGKLCFIPYRFWVACLGLAVSCCCGAWCLVLGDGEWVLVFEIVG